VAADWSLEALDACDRYRNRSELAAGICWVHNDARGSRRRYRHLLRVCVVQEIDLLK